MTPNGPFEVADGVFKLGSRHVNWYALVEGGSITVIDTGLPHYWSQLTHLLSSIGRSLSDIEAVLITHADPDHLGNAERLATECSATLIIHAMDGPAAMKQIRIAPPKVAPWRPAVLAFLSHGIRNGLLRWPALTSLKMIEHTARLDVPGRPLAIHTPGHTAGSMCFAFGDRDMVAVGDALFNQDPNTGRPGAMVSSEEFSWDHGAAEASLSHLAALNHRTVLFGHGDPSHEGIRGVVAQARTRIDSREASRR